MSKQTDKIDVKGAWRYCVEAGEEVGGLHWMATTDYTACGIAPERLGRAITNHDWRVKCARCREAEIELAEAVARRAEALTKAAPELLEALKLILADRDARGSLSVAQMAAARAAIAKTEGVEQ